MKGVQIVPVAIAYDLVLEDRVLARQGGVKRRQRPFAASWPRWCPGRRLPVPRRSSRSASPIPLDDYDAESRRDVLELAHRIARRDRPALQGAADGARRRGDAAVDHRRRPRVARRRRCSSRLRGRRRQPRRARRAARGRRGRRRALEKRGVIRTEGRDCACATAACCATTRARIQHLLRPGRAVRTATDARRPLEVVLPRPGPQQRRSSGSPRATAWRSRPASPGASSPARRSTRPSRPRAAIQARGLLLTLDQLGESVATLGRGRGGHAGLPRRSSRRSWRPASTATSR